jgi:hypothetical protein
MLKYFVFHGSADAYEWQEHVGIMQDTPLKPITSDCVPLSVTSLGDLTGQISKVQVPD